MKELIRRAVVWVLTAEARAVLSRYRPRIAIVTGSVGKTSAKDAAYTALSARHFVRRSEKSYNSDIGAPLTVLGVPNGWSNPIRWVRNIVDGFSLLLARAPYPEWLIIEVGADRPGDITRSLRWLNPDVVIATRFPAVPVHVEFYDSPEAVWQEELAPLSWLKPGGVAVINADDDAAVRAPIPDGAETLGYGLHAGDVRASGLRISIKNGMPRGIAFDIQQDGERVRVILEGVVGAQHVYAVLAGVAAARAIGVPLSDAAARFGDHAGPPGRMRLISGIKKSVLIDDTYNASPVATVEALRTLAQAPRKGRRIAILGDMLELGPYSVAEHERVGHVAAESADLLITAGVRARGIALGAEKAGIPTDAVLQFDTALDAAEHVKSLIAPGDLVLLKGSQSVRMERAVKELMAEPERAKELLCRQDAEWIVR